MLFTPITDAVANTIIAQLLYLDRDDPDKDVSLYIQSPGGIISAGLAIYDTMQLIRAPVSTICVGIAASMATVLLCAGAEGKRYALPNSTIHLHQAVGGPARRESHRLGVGHPGVEQAREEAREVAGHPRTPPRQAHQEPIDEGSEPPGHEHVAAMRVEQNAQGQEPGERRRSPQDRGPARADQRQAPSAR